jgi:tRNA dimethylallyltransferase
MDIGTAKPSALETTAVPHHLIDIKNPDEEYTAADYKRDAIAAINNIIKRRGIPLLVGGTGLYISTVIDNMNIPKVRPDPVLRAKIEKARTRGCDHNRRTVYLAAEERGTAL